MKSDRPAARRKRLLSRLRKEGVPALLVSNEKNVRYLTGFTGDSSYLLLSKYAALLISDSRYEVQIAEECPGIEMYVRTNRQKMPEVVAEVLKKAKQRHVGFESSSMTVSEWKSMDEEADAVEFVPLEGLVEGLREIKDADELAEIRRAVALAERGFSVMRASLTASMTEREFSHELEHTLRRFGGEGTAFEPIVGVGPHGALPHYRPGDTRLGESSFVLVDWGAESRGGYKSDLTRVLVTGNIPPKLEKIYRVVLTAQRRAIEWIAPGVACREVDAAARNHISKSGYGKYFGHGLGHGFGLDIHESPRLSPISESELKPGMVVTVEPGIYLPGWGGVRIEDDVLVTRDGHEVLTSVPKEFDEIVLPAGIE